MEDFEFITVREANARFDREHDLSEFVPIRSSLAQLQNIVGKKLTDKKITRYERDGYYSADFKQTRADLRSRKQAKVRREGNFEISSEGRMIYRP